MQNIPQRSTGETTAGVKASVLYVSPAMSLRRVQTAALKNTLDDEKGAGKPQQNNS